MTRHAAKRMRVRRGRVVAAAASALTVGIAVLGSSGILPISANGGFALAANQDNASPTNRDRNAADRGKRIEQASSEGGSEDGTAADPAASKPPVKRPASPPPEGPPVASADESLPASSGTGKRIVYRLATNHVWLVDESGKVVRHYLVSGTRFNQVKAGNYEVTKKTRNTTSYHGTEKMEYMVIFTRGKNANIGFHNIPVSISTGQPVQSLDQLGTPLSDGCVRQKQSDAKFLWDFSETDVTPVIVLT